MEVIWNLLLRLIFNLLKSRVFLKYLGENPKVGKYLLVKLALAVSTNQIALKEVLAICGPPYSGKSYLGKSIMASNARGYWYIDYDEILRMICSGQEHTDKLQSLAHDVRELLIQTCPNPVLLETTLCSENSLELLLKITQKWNFKLNYIALEVPSRDVLNKRMFNRKRKVLLGKVLSRIEEYRKYLKKFRDTTGIYPNNTTVAA